MITDQKRGEKETKCDNRDRANLLDLISSIRSIINIEKCFAVYRFRVVDEKLAPADVKSKTFGVIFTLIYAILFFKFNGFPFSAGSVESFMDVIQEVPQVVFLIGYATFTNLTSFFLSGVNIIIFSSLNRIDNILRIQTKSYYEKSRKNTLVFVTFVILYNFVYDMIGFWRSPKDVIKHALAWAGGVLHDLEILMFCKLLFMVKHRVDLINYHLNTFVNKKYKRKVQVFTITDEFLFIRNVKLADLASVYQAIGETCLSINTVFNPHIMMIILCTFFYMLLTMWTTIYYWKTTHDVSGTLITVMTWAVNGLLAVSSLSLTGEALLTSRNHTRHLLNKLIMDYSQSAEIRNQAKAFMGLVDAWPLRISVYDMFSVDVTLFLNYIRVSTTYLIIIIQVAHFE